jgi:hypothetical protein
VRQQERLSSSGTPASEALSPDYAPYTPGSQDEGGNGVNTRGAWSQARAAMQPAHSSADSTSSFSDAASPSTVSGHPSKIVIPPTPGTAGDAKPW